MHTILCKLSSSIHRSVRKGPEVCPDHKRIGRFSRSSNVNHTYRGKSAYLEYIRYEESTILDPSTEINPA